MQLGPLALGAFCCACVSGAAAAQSMPDVAGGRQFHGSLSVTGAYESNFARSGQAAADLRQIDPEEYILTPSANLQVVQPFGRQVVFLTGSGGYDFHRNNPRLDRNRYDVQAGYSASLGMCQLSALEGFRAAQSDLADIDTLVTKNELKTTTTSVTAACGRPTGIAGSATASRADTKNSAVVQKPADSTLESLTVQFGYRNERIGGLGLVYGYSTSELPNSINPGRPIGDGFWTTMLGVSFTRDIGSRLTVNGQVGRTRVKREFAPPGVPQKFSSTTYAVDASYRFGSRMTVNLSGSQAINPSTRAGKLYDITTTGTISGQYDLGTRYSVSAGAAIKDVDSNADSLALRPTITNSRTESVFGSVTYRQNDRASVSLDVRHDDRNANLPEFNYSSTRVAITAEVGF